MPIDDREPPLVDLHPSEWSHGKKHEPFWGYGAPTASTFWGTLAAAFAANVFFTWLVTGGVPQYLQRLLQ